MDPIFSQLTDQDFTRISKLVYDLTGIVINDQKREMIYGRLVRTMRERQIYSFSDYIDKVETRDTNYITEFINSVTTNLTSFFREKHHFDHLTEVLSDLYNKKSPIKIWSAGCSSGQEPYSIAITASETIPNISRYDFKILATDIDTEILEYAANGVYKTQDLSGLTNDMLSKYFNSNKNENAQLNEAMIKPAIRNLIRFNQLNLHGSWPIRKKFNVIFCRNVVIYFDKEKQAKLFDRFADSIEEGGFLYIGHSETMNNICNRFELIGKTIYRKIS